LTNKYQSFVLNSASSSKSSWVDVVLLSLTFLSILFIPSIKIHNELFLGLDEFLVLLMGLRLLLKRFFWIDQLVLVFVLLSCIILSSILLNSNRADYREYLEVNKVLKFVVFYLFSIFVFTNYNNKKGIIYFVSISFIGLLIFNVLHLFNLFYFNEFITILYDTDGRDVLNFGKNSIGGPGPKRIVGTMGNPNINAILFLFFVSFYSFLLVESKKVESSWNYFTPNTVRALFLLSILLVILCQSRTGIVALVIIYLFGLYYRRAKLFEILLEILLIIGFFGLSAFLDTIALQYLFNTKPQLQENNSLAVRLKIWGKLINMWTEQPFFGYGPNKAYVYREKLHPENEYIFYLWRYGIQGVVTYLSILLVPILYYRSRIKEFTFLIFVVLVVSLVAFMNNPLSNPKISVLFALILGFSVVQFSQNKQKSNYSE
jgi:O-antigen ligase